MGGSWLGASGGCRPSLQQPLAAFFLAKEQFLHLMQTKFMGQLGLGEAAGCPLRVSGLLVSVALWRRVGASVWPGHNDRPAGPIDANQPWSLSWHLAVPQVDCEALARKGTVESLYQYQSVGRIVRGGKSESVKHRKVMVAGQQGVAIPDAARRAHAVEVSDDFRRE